MVTSIDLCCGAGGLSIGLEQAGITPILMVDNDKHCIATLKANNLSAAVLADIAELDYSVYSPDVLTAGFPCQPFSSAGKRGGLQDGRSNAFYSVLRAIEQCNPKLWLLENVAGLATHDKGQTLKTIVQLINERLGATPFIYCVDTVDYLVPQHRKRIIICSHPLKLQPNLNKLTLRDALKDCPESPGMLYSPAKHKVMSLVPMGCNWRSLPDDVARDYMKTTYFASGGRTGIARRLHWNKPSPTIPCSPSQKQTELCHPEQTRPLTIRECARIQTFSDSYQFSGSIANQYKQIGNAVPVRLGVAL